MSTDLLQERPSRAAEGDLLGFLLREQSTCTAVEAYASWHDREHDQPAQAKYYERLLPLEPLAAGEQYAFEVDLDGCSGCKACVTACHNLNGLEPEETWRSVGLLTSNVAELPIIQPVTTACHHCLEPGCLAGCPVQAYEKNAATGIVHHLDDQCIGCQYCVLMCPYEVPQYSVAKGIVRKCDMCRHRLARDEAPACVQSCPNGAIRITKVARAEIVSRAKAGEFLADAPEPRLTQPTTRFLSANRSQTSLSAADANFDRPAHGHEPLAIMLVLTQCSVGMLLVERTFVSHAAASMVLLVAAAILGSLGGAAAMLHLGRPAGAWRAWLGWRTSWLSREIMAFGAYGALGGQAAFMSFLYGDVSLTRLLAWLAAAAGIAAVACSIMIYVATGRAIWSLARTGARFIATALLTGSAFALVVFTVIGSEQTAAFAVAVIALQACKLAIEAEPLAARDPFVRRSGRLAVEQLRGSLVVRLTLALICGIALPPAMLCIASRTFAIPTAMICFVGVLVGEMLERSLFFRAAVAPRMPGGVPA